MSSRGIRVADYISVEELQSLFPEIFPDVQSLKSYITKRRWEFYDFKAFILINGRARFHPRRFEKALIASAALDAQFQLILNSL